MYKLFPYSGSKQWMFKYDLQLPAFERIVEPYAGSVAFSLNHEVPFVAYEIEPQLHNLYNYLKHCCLIPNGRSVLEETLKEMDEIRASNLEKSIDVVFPEKDTPKLKFMYSLIRLCCCGLYVGAFTSKKIYPQHTLPIANMLSAFDRLQRTDWQVVDGCALRCYSPQEGDFVFMDPPYLRTVGGYKVDKTFSLEHTYKLIDRCQQSNTPFLLTYGTGAQDDFPMLKGWELLRMKTASKVNTTGKNVREENIYRSWLHGV